MEIKLGNNNYKIIKNEKDGFDKEELEKRFDEFFEPYDFIVGDWAYGKLRLKGFCNKKNKVFNKINDAERIEKYITENCAYGCRYFVIEKIK